MEKGQVFGQNSLGLLAKYDHASHSWRTFQLSLFEEEPESLETLPKSGMTVNGKLWEQTMWAHHTGGRESGLWLTPTATEYFPPLKNISKIDPKKMKKRGKHSLATQVHHPQMWPTPRAQDAKHGAATEWELNTDHAGTRDSLRVQVEHRKTEVEAGGSLNPQWVEWLMGYPSGWTDLED